VRVVVVWLWLVIFGVFTDAEVGNEWIRSRQSGSVNGLSNCFNPLLSHRFRVCYQLAARCHSEWERRALGMGRLRAALAN
jgi:hypothetical protein